MKNLKNYIYEGLLSGVDTHLSLTDDDLKNMEIIKDWIKDNFYSKNYDGITVRKEHGKLFVDFDGDLDSKKISNK